MNHLPIIPASTSPGAHPNRARQVLRHLARLAATIAIVGLPGCGLFSTEHRVIGIIDFDDSAWPLPRIPETATAGVPLEMVVSTMATGCYRQGGTEVEVDGRSAVVTPYDFLTTGGDAACPAPLGFFEHGATVVFEEPGTAEIVLVYSTGTTGKPWHTESHKGDGRKVYTVEVAEAGAT